MKERYPQAAEYMEWFCPVWAQLTEEQRYVIEMFYGEDNQYGRNAADEITAFFNIEKSSAYRRKNWEFDRLTVLLSGNA